MITFKHTLLFSLFSLLIFVSQSYAQQPPKVDAKAQHIIDRYLKAIGGRENLAKVKSWKTFGQVTNQGVEATMSVTIKYDKVRMEMNILGQHFIQAYDGVDAWEVHPMENGGKPRYALNAKPNALNVINMYYPMFLLGRDRDLAVYDSTGTWQGKQVQVLHCGEGPEQKIYYFDQKTGLLLYRKTFSMLTNIQGYTSQQDASGLYLPRGIKTNTPEGLLLIDSIQANPKVADSLFVYTGKIGYATNQFEQLITEGKTLDVVPDLKVDDIVAKYAKVYQAMNNGVQSVQMRGDMYLNKSKNGFPIYLVVLTRSNQMYMEMNLGGKIFKSANDGNISWELNPFKSKEPVLKKDEGNDFSFNLSDYDLISYKERGYTAKYVARAYIGKTLCHKIALVKSPEVTTYFYLDAQTYASVKTVDKGKQNACYFLEHERKEGRLIPKFVYLIQEGGMHLVLKADKWIFNEPVDKKLFEFPKKKK